MPLAPVLALHSINKININIDFINIFEVYPCQIMENTQKEDSMAISTQNSSKADYGLDAPGLVRGFLLGGGTAVIIGVGLLLWGAQLPNWLLGGLGIYILLMGVCFAGTSALMLR